MSQFVAADIKTLDFPLQDGPFCQTSPADVDTLTLDWALQIGPFIAYVDGVVAQQPRGGVMT